MYKKKYYIRKTFKFHASHAVKIHGAFENQHGHTFLASITYQGDKNDEGLIVDFQELERFINKEILSSINRVDLNKTFKNPTTENIAEFIWSRAENFSDSLILSEVMVCEDEESCVFIKRMPENG